jgi:RNA polymerase sigma-70 factor (ECF subfamily)
MSRSVTLPVENACLPDASLVNEMCRTKARVEQEIEAFLKSVERRAFRVAELSLRHPDDALDVVQDSMLQLVRHYAARAPAEWPPLFYRILRNRIRDAQRRRRTRNRLIPWWSGGMSEEDSADDPIDAAVSIEPTPDESLSQDQAMGRLAEAVRRLPDRQREAFLLRSLEGFDVATTAHVMGCSQGSVKTHYFRALAHLRAELKDHKT